MSRSSSSLTTRLSLLIAAVAVLVFSAVGVYLYRSLATQLQDRDDADLVDRTMQIRHLLEEASSVASILAEPHRFLDAVDLRRGLLLVMQSDSGQVLAKNTDERAFVPGARYREPGAQLSTDDARSATLADGTPIRVISALGKVGAGNDVVRITLARTADERLAVLSAYRLKVWAAAVAGVVLTAALGYLLVNRGLQKVRALAAQAQQVSAHNLELRLSVESAPAELQLLADSFNDVLDRLQNSFNNLSQFADDLAHDLRTPLNNLMVQTEVAFSQPRSSEEYQSLLSSNHEEFGRLARMVEGMLFLARADHDQVALNTEALDVSDELATIAEYFEGPASEAEASFIINATGTVTADAHLLRRAVSNLVANAIRYTPQSGTIALEAIQGPAGVTISVTNPGAGIDPEHLPRLFERFYRSDKARSSKSTSAGLGLAIVKSIMTLHGGSASVASERDGLTRFSLFFPAQGRLAPKITS